MSGVIFSEDLSVMKSDIKLVLVGGGSYGWTYKFITDIACVPELNGTHVVLQDIDPEALALVAPLCRRISYQLGANLRIETSSDLEAALPGADFVGLTISTGGDEANALDLSIPAKHGILQTVGDTGGPGGWSRALRNIPVVVGIARKIQRRAPRAWFMNYSNPMTTLTRTIQRTCPVKTVGLCHELQGFLLHVAAFLGVARWDQDIKVRMGGINHLIWVTQMDILGQDGLALLRDYLRRHPKLDHAESVPELLRDGGGVNFNQKIKFDFLDKIGCLPAAGDAHTAEFFEQFLSDAATAAAWGVGADFHTFAHVRGAEQRKAFVQRLLRGEEPLALRHSHEHASKIIAALAGGEPLVTPVNTANVGQIDNLPREAVVETLALVDSLGVQPLAVGGLPEPVVQSLTPHIDVQEMIVEAGLKGDRDLAVQALARDPRVHNPDIAAKIAADFFAAFKDSLPQFNGKWKLE